MCWSWRALRRGCSQLCVAVIAAAAADPALRTLAAPALPVRAGGPHCSPLALSVCYRHPHWHWECGKTSTPEVEVRALSEVWPWTPLHLVQLGPQGHRRVLKQLDRVIRHAGRFTFLERSTVSVRSGRGATRNRAALGVRYARSTRTGTLPLSPHSVVCNHAAGFASSPSAS